MFHETTAAPRDFARYLSEINGLGKPFTRTDSRDLQVSFNEKQRLELFSVKRTRSAGGNSWTRSRGLARPMSFHRTKLKPEGFGPNSPGAWVSSWRPTTLSGGIVRWENSGLATSPSGKQNCVLFTEKSSRLVERAFLAGPRQGRPLRVHGANAPRLRWPRAGDSTWRHRGRSLPEASNVSLVRRSRHLSER
jgi:hypothetical protein